MICMENVRVSWIENKLTTPFHLQSSCLTGSLHMAWNIFKLNGKIPAVVQINEFYHCNKHIHRFSSSGIKSSKRDACSLYMTLEVYPSLVLSFLFFLTHHETESKTAPYNLSWGDVWLSPDSALAHFWRKQNINKNKQANKKTLKYHFLSRQHTDVEAITM